jgi:multidrug efflux system outer membrane protein
MRAVLKTLTALGLTALIGGCSLDPAYNRPALPTPNVFPQSAAGGSDTGAPPATKPVASIPWQDFFLDPKLRALVKLALANNRDLRVALANIQAARAQYHVQRAALLPTIDATASADYGREQISTTSGGGVTDYNEHQYNVGLGFTDYQIDLFGRVRSLSKAALEQYLATEQARRASQITIISEVASDYITLSADKATLKAAQDTLTSSRESLKIAKGRFDNGIDSELDVRQAETLVDQTQADVAADVTTVAQDKNALDLVVGSPTPDDLSPADLGGDVALLTNLPPGLPSDVLLARPDILQAEHQLKAENAQIGAARAAFFPSISLTGSGGFTSTALSTLFKGSSGIWSFTPEVSLPIFDGGLNKGNLDYAKAERNVYLAQYEKAVQTAFHDVANALARRATISDQLSADAAQVTAAAASLKLSQARYEQGADTYLNVLIAQRTLYAAQQSLISARLIRSTNLIALYTALGGGESSANED